MASISDGDDPLVMPLLKDILLQGHQSRHDAVPVESAKGDVFTDLIVDMFLCQVFHLLLGILRDVIPTEGLLDCLEQEPISAVHWRMNNEITSSSVRARLLSSVGHALGPLGDSENALGADGDS